MLDGKYISVKRIIEKVYSDNSYSFELPISDLIEWIADVLDLIDYPDQYEKKITGYKDYPPFDIKDWKAPLPCNFHQLLQIAVDGYPAYPANHNFHHLMSGDCCGIDDLGQVKGDSFTDNFGNVFQTSLGTRYNSDPITYTLNNDWITLSNQKGRVCMSYLAFPTDDDGFPLIPDDVSYKECVKWYLTHKLDWIEFRKGSISREIYNISEQKYLWFLGSASTSAKIPGLDKMENIKNQMLRMAPKVNSYASFFKDLAFRETRPLK